MKFSKEFTSQMVTEWQGAYLDYSYLKSLLKDYQIFKEEQKSNNHGGGGGSGGGPGADGLPRALSLYKPFGGLLTRSLSRIGSAIHRDHHHQHHHHHHDDDIEEQVILEVKSKEGSYQTKFMFSSDDGGEYELMFFKRLDDEFNKVNKFYKNKVEEVMKEAAVLNKQMDALIAFRIKVHNPEGVMELHHDYHNQLVDMKAAEALHIEGLMSSSFTPATNDHEAAERAHMDAIEESDLSGRGYSDTFSEEGSSRGISDETSTSAEDVSVNDKTTVVNLTSISEEKPKQIRARRPTPLKILDSVKINNTLETPRSTIKGILKMNNNQELSFGKDNLKKVEEQLKDAFIHFHHKLELLKSYSFVNLSAVFHIMKKYDKITGRNASKPYLHMVDNSYIGNSDDVTNIMERVEAAFIKHFSNSNHSKGMNILKPKIKRQRHRTSFSTGFFSGGSVALLVSLILLIRARNLIKSEGSAQYMETMFPLYSLFGFIIIQMLLFAGNIYFWRRYRVNYPFIFGLKKGKDLGYREILLLSACLSTLALAAVLANLDMEMDGNTKDYKMFTELVPLALVSLVFLIMVCPFNIIYRSTRFYLLTRALHCTLAPLYKVSLADMFFADQISSQAQALRNVAFYICYYGRGDFKTRQTTCKSNDVYSTFYFILAALGFWWRFLQCARRFFEEKDRLQGYNALKYFSIIVAISIRTAYTKQPTMAWLVLAWISSIGAGIVATWWDIVIDWGLFQRNSKNRWLRDKLLVSHKSVYFAAIGWNIFGRFAWLETVLGLQVSFLHKEALLAIVQSIEIIRRGVWNFFRLENEHLNNVGHYRAFKSVPLPFNYDDDEEDKDD